MNAESTGIELRFCEGSSDKVYRAAITPRAGGYVVDFAYGRRGSTLSTGSKTPHPVSYAEAVSIYERLVRSKTGKGYKPVETAAPATGIGASVRDRVRRDTGLRAQLLSPITEEDSESYCEDDDWCAQEKFDGRRMMIRKAGQSVIATNRNGLETGVCDAVALELAGIRADFVADGESVGDRFHAFDLLELGAEDCRHTPYVRRLELLDTVLGSRGGNSVLVARTVITGSGKRAFMAELKAAGREGIVFKRLSAGWSAGLAAACASALKLKFWATCSCVVVAVNARRSVELALGGIGVGNVTIPPNKAIPGVGEVVEVRYLYVQGQGGSLYQPTYIGVRDDVEPGECTVAKQRLKYRQAA